MITEYVADFDNWEDWQREYRYGSILLFPPEPVRSQVNHLRNQYDPISQAICDAHISLTVPLPKAVSETDWREVGVRLANWRPFDITYGPLRHYLPHPGVCLRIEPQATLEALVSTLEGSPVFKGAPARGHGFSAHMTIAEFVSVAETLTLMSSLEAEAPAGRYVCTGVSYVVPDKRFHFSERRFLQFTARESAEVRTA